MSSEMLSECDSKSQALLSLVTVQKVPLSLTWCQLFSNLIGRQHQVLKVSSVHIRTLIFHCLVSFVDCVCFNPAAYRQDCNEAVQKANTR